MNQNFRGFLLSFLFLFFAALSGCSCEHVRALYLINKADSISMKAHEMRSHPDLEAKRLEMYREVCHYALQAYDLDRSVFTLARIETGIDGCLRVENSRVEELRAFAEQYMAEHPTEAAEGEMFIPLE